MKANMRTRSNKNSVEGHELAGTNSQPSSSQRRSGRTGKRNRLFPADTYELRTDQIEGDSATSDDETEESQNLRISKRRKKKTTRCDAESNGTESRTESQDVVQVQELVNTSEEQINNNTQSNMDTSITPNAGDELSDSNYNRELHLIHLQNQGLWMQTVIEVEKAFYEYGKEETNDIMDLFRTITKATEELKKISKRKRASHDESEEELKNRIRQLVSKSMLGNANNLLKSEGLHRPTILEIEEKLAVSQEKLECEKDDLEEVMERMRLHTANNNHKKFTHEEVMRKIESSKSNATTDSHGLSVNILKTIARRGNENACRGISKAILCILNGNLQTDANAWLNETRQVTLKKKRPGDFRRIGITNSFLTIADALALSTVSEALSKTASNHQFGNKPDGIARAAVTAQIVLEDDAGMTSYYHGNKMPKQELAVLHLDIADAFDSIKRSKVLTMLEGLHANHLAYFGDRLGSDTALIFEVDGSELSRTTSFGVPQGRCSSSLLFDAIYAKCLSEGGVFSNKVRIILIHDDFYAIGCPADLLTLHNKFTDAIKTIGLHENISKREFFAFNDETAREMQDLFQGITRCLHGLNLGGIPIGTDEYRLEELREKDKILRNRTCQLLEDNKGSVETVYGLLKLCISPAWNHILRANELVAKAEDDEIQDLVRSEENIIREFMKSARQQAGLPVPRNPGQTDEWCHFDETRDLFFRRSSYGGLGITSCVDSSTAALLGGYAAIGNELVSNKADGGVGCKLLERSVAELPSKQPKRKGL